MLIAEDPAMDIAPAPPPARPWPGDRAGALDALLSRRSCPPRLLSDPAPSDDHLRLMVEAAVRAPDHAGLRPWRFICIQDAARVRLGGALATAYMCRHRSASRDQLDRERMKPLRAPMVLAVAAAVTLGHPRGTVMDQQLAAGAAAMNLLNVAHVLGYGGIWLTGESCHDANIKRALGLAPGDFIAGWLYLGTPSGDPAPVRRPGTDDVLRHWTGLPA